MTTKIVHRDGDVQVQSEDGKFVVYRLEARGTFDTRKEAMAYLDDRLNPKSDPNSILGWHFIDPSLTLIHGDGRKVVAGETIHVDGPIVPQKNGLLVSTKAITALKFGRRPIVCRVQGSGEMVTSDGIQYAVSDRTCLWLADATKTVVQWAGWCVRRGLEEMQARGLSVNPASLEAANAAEHFAGGDPGSIMQLCMAASQAVFQVGWGGDPAIAVGAQAGSMVAQAVQAASRMTGFGGFPTPPFAGFGAQQFPQFAQQFPGAGGFGGFPSAPGMNTPATAIGSMDFAITNAEGAAEQIAKVFQDPLAERELQNEELERQLLSLEPSRSQARP